MTTSPARGAPC